MKNTFLIIIYCLAVLLSSCVHYTEDLFDKPAADRIAESLQVYRELLTAQTNGWLVEYYPEKTQKYGGFNLYFSFEGVNVTMRSEIDPALSISSTWSLGTDMGPTINFDTYNKVLHYFSDPAIPQGGGYGLNYEGDYEFVVESGSEVEFILRGKKTGNIIRMTPLPANLTWDEYSQFLNEMDQNVIAPAYKMTVGGKDVSIAKSVGTNVFTLKINNMTVSAPFIVTQTGIKFYEPITLLNETLQVFTYDAAKDKIISDQGNAEISFEIVPLAKYFVDHLTSTDWFFCTEHIAPASPFETAWNTAKNNLENALDETLYAMWLGRLFEDFPVGITFASWDYENNRPWIGTYAYDITPVDDTRIKFVYNSARTSADGINANYYMSYLQSFTITSFNGKTFALETDVDIITNPKNMARIKEMKITDDQNPNNWIKVVLEEKIWP